MPALNFYARDIYGTGYADTRNQTVPEADDQMALVDDEELAVKNPVNQDPAIPRNMLIGIIVMIVVIFAFSV